MKKIFSLALMATALLISGQVKAVNVSTFSDLQTYVQGTEDVTIVLQNDITLASKLYINNGQKITIDMNGNDLDVNGHTAFYINHGQIILIGAGRIEGSPTDGNAIVRINGGATDAAGADYSVVKVGKDVVLYSQLYGIQIPSTNYTSDAQSFENAHSFGLVVEVEGEVWALGGCGIYLNGNIKDHGDQYANLPKVTVAKTGKIYGPTAIDPELKAKQYDFAGIYAGGYAIWDIQGYVSGTTGIYAKAGEFEVNDAQIVATGAYEAPTGYTNGFNGCGDAFVCDSHGGYAGQIEVTVTGDTKVSAANGNAIHEVVTNGNETTNKIEITGGTFVGGSDSEAEAVNISTLGKDNKIVEVAGGTYSTTVEQYIDKSTGAIIVESVDKNGNEVFVVSNTGTGSEVQWKTNLLTATENDFVKLNNEEATQNVVDVNQNITCEYLAVLGYDSVTVKAGKRLKTGEIVLGKDASLVIEPGAVVLVTGDKGLYSPAPENFVIKCKMERNVANTRDSLVMGTFAFNPDVESNRSPWATVEYIPNAYYRTGTKDYKFDMFSFPFVKGSLTSVTRNPDQPTSYQHVVAGHWVEIKKQELMSIVEPFEAIAITNTKENANGVVYTFKGQLQGNISGKISLKKGFNYIGNPYFSSMVASEIIKGAPAKVSKYISMWNGAGYFRYNNAFVDNAPDMNAMNMFVLWADDDVEAQFDYEKLIWNKINK